MNKLARQYLAIETTPPFNRKLWNEYYLQLMAQLETMNELKVYTGDSRKRLLDEIRDTAYTVAFLYGTLQ